MVKKWMKYSLLLAGIYNLLLGTLNVLFPLSLFKLTGTPVPRYPEIWQCIGMIVGVYGIGYIISAYSPFRHWPIILVGFLGKIFGPIGFLYALSQGVFPLKFGLNIIFNDLIWWVPFGLILKAVYDHFYCGTKTHHLTKDQIQLMPERERARLINSLSGFKSANLIGTQDTEMRTNLSIVSSVFHIGSSPALIGFIIRPDSVRRDTIENIRSQKSFTLNHVNSKIYKQAHQTSARYPKERSEFLECNLTPEYRANFDAPFVQEAHIKMGMKFIREEKIPENGTVLIISEVINIQLPLGCLRNDGSINIEKADSVTVSGLDSYHQTISLSRLSYAKVDKWVEEII